LWQPCYDELSSKTAGAPFPFAGVASLDGRQILIERLARRRIVFIGDLVMTDGVSDSGYGLNALRRRNGPWGKAAAWLFTEAE